jgi:membrane-associated phospholipid phosphatase
VKAWRIWILPAVCVFAFAGVVATASNQAWFVVLNKIGPLTGNFLWANITVIGDTLVALALCLPLWRRRPDLVWALLFAVLLATFWVQGLKHVLEVARPPAVMPELHVIGPAYKAGSFPSGHATTAFAIAGLFALGIRSGILTGISLIIAIAVAISRSVVGVHWPLDILAGAFGGWLAAAAALWLGQRTRDFGMRPWVQWILGCLLIICSLILVFGHHRSGYPQADFLQRAIGLACLLFAGARLIRDFRSRPGL